MLPGQHRFADLGGCPSGCDCSGVAGLAVFVPVVLAIARLGGCAASAARTLVAALDGFGLLAR